MPAIQIVSVDLFNTLADLSTDRQILWRTFLGEGFSPARGEQGWDLMGELVFAALGRLNATSTFQPLRTVFQACYAEVFSRLQIPFAPETAARALTGYHAQRPWFPGAVPALDALRQRYRLCLASDTDEEMIGEHVRQYPFDTFFTSAHLQVYKGDAQNRFFRAVLDYYGLAASQILHVGDSSSEIIAAQRLGLQACWVHRAGRSWAHAQPPTYEVVSLEALVPLLDEVGVG